MRVLQIGLGRRGRNILRNLSRLYLEGLIEEIFIYDVLEEAVKKAMKAYRIAKEGSLEGDYDAVFIVTPPSTHFELAEKFLSRDIHAFIEKPPVLSVTELEELLKHNAVISADMLLRYLPVNNFLKSIEPKYLEASRTSIPSRSVDVSVVRDIMIHDLDLAFFLYGPREVIGAERIYDLEGFPSASAARAYLRGMSFTAARTLKSIRIRDRRIRTEDAVYVVNTSDNTVRIYEDGKVEELSFRGEEPLYASIRDFIEAIEHKRRPLNALETLRDTIRACEKIDSLSRA